MSLKSILFYSFLLTASFFIGADLKKGSILDPLLTDSRCIWFGDKTRYAAHRGTLPVIMSFEKGFPQKMRPAILLAAETWNKAAGRDIILIKDQVIVPGKNYQDNQNVIYLSKAWDRNQYETAVTTIFSNSSKIAEVDIFFNGKMSFGNAAWGMDTESVALHEFGHVLGIAHSKEAHAAMFESLTPGQTKRALTQVEIDALACVLEANAKDLK